MGKHMELGVIVGLALAIGGSSIDFTETPWSDT